MRDVRGLARPWRNGSRPRRDHDETGLRIHRGRVVRIDAWAVGEQRLQNPSFLRRELATRLHEVHEPGRQRLDSGVARTKGGQEFTDAEFGESRRASQCQHCGRWTREKWRVGEKYGGGWNKAPGSCGRVRNGVRRRQGGGGEDRPRGWFFFSCPCIWNGS